MMGTMKGRDEQVDAVMDRFVELARLNRLDEHLSDGVQVGLRERLRNGSTLFCPHLDVQTPEPAVWWADDAAIVYCRSCAGPKILASIDEYRACLYCRASTRRSAVQVGTVVAIVAVCSACR